MRKIIKYKKYIIMISTILILSTLFVGIKYIMLSKYEELPEVELKNELKKDKSLAIMVSEDGNEYVEYTKGNTWPGIEYKFREAKCVNEDGQLVENALNFDKEKRKASLKIKETVYCTLYFDYYGTGEEEDPYRIQYIEDLVDLQVAVNNGETYAGKYFELERDLDFQKNDSYRDYQTKEYSDINGNSTDEELKTELTTEKGWKPIGNTSKQFSGIFDGKENRIDNLTINYLNEETTEERLGLFGFTNNATVKNLTIGGNINIIPSYSNTGGIIGLTGNNTLIDNCHNEVNITSQASGYTNGGLVGALFSGTIKNSSNSGNISGGNNAGGLVGVINGNSIIENSYNKGNITNTKGQNVGGLVGRDATDTDITTIKNSYNEGTIISNQETESETHTGGFIGVVYGTINIDDSHNSGEVRNDKKTYTQALNIPLGGFIGQIFGNSKNINRITNSYNEGHLIGATKQGGIIGFNTTNSITIINNVYNKGTNESQIVSGGNQTTVSGIVGYNSSSKLYILNTYNEGDISSIRTAQGIVYSDYGATTSIINSYNIGNINGSTWTGGIFVVSPTIENGVVNNVKLNNVYNLGEVTGSNAYELGYRYGNTAIVEITNSYYQENKNGTNISDVDGTPLNNMLSQTFVDLLNSNKNVIDLNNIDSILSEYKLCDWKLGESGYPELAC